MSEKVIFSKVISKYGEYTQLDMAIEEMAELIQAINKLKRGKEHNVEEEIADVEIMIKQMKMMSLIDTNLIDEIKHKKIKRLEKSLM